MGSHLAMITERFTFSKYFNEFTLYLWYRDDNRVDRDQISESYLYRRNLFLFLFCP